MTADERTRLLELCQLNRCGYSLATTGHCVLPDGFTAPVAIRIGSARPRLLASDPLDIFGYVTAKQGRSYLVFRGTQITSGIEFAQEWIQDALSLPLTRVNHGYAHLGFTELWRDLIGPTITALGEASTSGLLITGHSLGAAIATLAWDSFGGELVTFAGPRVGGKEFATAMWGGNCHRIVNRRDIVPDVPTDPPFRHGGRETDLSVGSRLHPKAAHRLDAYEAGLRGMVVDAGDNADAANVV